MSRELTHLSLERLSHLIRTREISPVALTEAYLRRIEELNPSLHAYISVFAETALADARRAEDEIGSGGWRGPLHGIGVGLKDNVYSREGPTTCHSRVLAADHALGRDAQVTKRLRQAGAIILGKLSMWEFATGGTTEDHLLPAARNPWDLSRSANGSSSGSAVAVAAGLCAASVGTDTGGSIRNPAAWCGVAGLKPTYDVVSREGVYPVSWSLDHVGPLAWSSADCALMLQAMAEPGADLRPACGRALRVGILRHYFHDGDGVDPSVLGLLGEGERLLAARGHTTVDVEFPRMRLFQDVGLQIARSEAFAVHEAALRDTPDLYGPAARRRLMMGAFVRASDYVNAQRERRRLLNGVLEIMNRVDVVLLPSFRFTACAHGQDVLGASGAFFGRPFNITGQPAVAAPMGEGADGLPLSLQLAGRPGEDLGLLRLAAEMEAELGQRHRPTLSVEPPSGSTFARTTA